MPKKFSLPHFLLLMAVFTLTVLLPLSGQSAQNFGPRTLEELGFVTQDKVPARILEGSEVAWKDDQRLSELYPGITHYNDKEKDQILLNNEAVLTEFEQNLVGIRIDKMPFGRGSIKVVHPLGYHRAGYVEVRGLHNEVLGLADLKFIGWGPEGISEPFGPTEQRFIFDFVSDKAPVTPAIVKKILWKANSLQNTIKKRRVLSKLSLRTISKDQAIEVLGTMPFSRRQLMTANLWTEEQLSDRIRDGIRKLRTSLPRVEAKSNLYGLLANIAQHKSQNPETKTDPQTIATVLELVRKIDHSDGVGTFTEAVTEVTNQIATQVAMDIWNFKNGTHYKTVASHAITVHSYNVINAEGELERAATVGRDPHWAFHHEFYLPIPKEILKDRRGLIQSDGLGAMVDFGPVQISDPRVREFYGIRKGLRDVNEDLAHEAVLAYLAGDKLAIYKHIEKMTKPLVDYKAWLLAQKVPARKKPDTDVRTQKWMSSTDTPLGILTNIVDGWIAKGRSDFFVTACFLRLAKAQPEAFKKLAPLYFSKIEKVEVFSLSENLLPALIPQQDLIEPVMAALLARYEIKISYIYVLAMTTAIGRDPSHLEVSAAFFLKHLKYGDDIKPFLAWLQVIKQRTWATGVDDFPSSEEELKAESQFLQIKAFNAQGRMHDIYENQCGRLLE